jgi:putative sterol carrier protein
MTDAVPFATDAWIKRLGEECNRSPAYQEAAKSWEGDFYFIVEPADDAQEPVYMYIDLYHGRCRRAFAPQNPQEVEPEFRISGPWQVWRAIAERQLDPIKAMLMRQLSVKGNLAKIMQNVRAANALVQCTTTFETEFPPEVEARFL